MPSIKKYLEFIKENQTKIQFKDIDPFTFDIDDFLSLCKDHGLVVVGYRLGVVEREENDFDYINDSHDIFPFEEYEMGYKIEFERNSSSEFDNDTLELLINYLNIEHSNWDIFPYTTFDTFTLNVISNNIIKLKLEDWLKFYREYEIKDGKILVECNQHWLVDKFKYEHEFIENVLAGYDNTDYYFNYDELDMGYAIDPIDDDNIKLICDILTKNENLDVVKNREFIEQNLNLIPDNISDEMLSSYNGVMVEINESEAYEKIISHFEKLLQKEFSLIIEKSEIKNDELYYWYRFNLNWIDDIKKDGGSISTNTNLNHIFQMWFEVVYGGYKIDFDTPEIIFSTWLDEKQKRDYNSEIKSILLNHLNKTV